MFTSNLNKIICCIDLINLIVFPVTTGNRRGTGARTTNTSQIRDEKCGCGQIHIQGSKDVRTMFILVQGTDSVPSACGSRTNTLLCLGPRSTLEDDWRTVYSAGGFDLGTWLWQRRTARAEERRYRKLVAWDGSIYYSGSGAKYTIIKKARFISDCDTFTLQRGKKGLGERDRRLQITKGH